MELSIIETGNTGFAQISQSLGQIPDRIEKMFENLQLVADLNKGKSPIVFNPSSPSIKIYQIFKEGILPLSKDAKHSLIKKIAQELNCTQKSIKIKRVIDDVTKMELELPVQSMVDYLKIVSDGKLNEWHIIDVQIKETPSPKITDNKQLEEPNQSKEMHVFQFDESQLHFEAEDGKEYRFPLTNGKLIKLGDGSFGIVYKIIDSESKAFAIKLFYKQHEKDNEAEDRYKLERGFARKIREQAEQQNKTPDLSALLNPVTGTTVFLDKPAGKQLGKYFNEQDITISSYAIISELYDCTLKELLENPNSYSQQTGYAILESMDFDNRARTILPFLQIIASGIKHLYSGNYNHLDIKPANIFVKEERNNPAGFAAVVGDLGFLKKNIWDNTYLKNIRENLPLGTRHYRSPEQKDYFDISDVEVRKEPNSKIITLIVRDPKFDDTIIEAGDILMFSKSPGILYDIKSLENNENERFIQLTFYTQKPEKIFEEKRTQIILYKNQDVRTDLFGLGAIAFDMLTCGRSPERFYDNIRGLDSKKENVDSLLRSYERIESFQASDPHLLHIFEPFKHKQSSKYAPKELVELILKCMMYKAQNTYYNDYVKKRKKSENEYHHINSKEEILKSVETILRNLVAKYTLHSRNPLITGKKTESKIPDASLKEKINELYELKESQYHVRLFKGLKYLSMLIERVQNTLTYPEKEFLAELLPDNLLITSEENQLTYLFPAYNSRDDYKVDLIADNVHTKISRDHENFFVPQEFVHMRRQIRLKPYLDYLPNETPMSDEYKQVFKYEFISASFTGDKVREGDWIIVPSNKTNEREDILWRIGAIDEVDKVIVLENDRNTDQIANHILEILSDPQKAQNIIYYRNIDRTAYYLYVLGVYVQHLFFVNIGNGSRETPEYMQLLRYYFRNAQNAVSFSDPQTLCKTLANTKWSNHSATYSSESSQKKSVKYSEAKDESTVKTDMDFPNDISSEEDERDLNDLEFSAESPKVHQEEKDQEIQETNQPVSSITKEDLKHFYLIMLRIVELYAKFVLIDSNDSFYQTGGDGNRGDRLRMREIFRNLNQIKQEIAILLDAQGVFDHMREDDPELVEETEEYKNIQQKVPIPLADYVNFNELLETVVNLNHKAVRSTQKEELVKTSNSFLTIKKSTGSEKEEDSDKLKETSQARRILDKILFPNRKNSS